MPPKQIKQPKATRAKRPIRDNDDIATVDPNDAFHHVQGEDGESILVRTARVTGPPMSTAAVSVPEVNASTAAVSVPEVNASTAAVSVPGVTAINVGTQTGGLLSNDALRQYIDQLRTVLKLREQDLHRLRVDSEQATHDLQRLRADREQKREIIALLREEVEGLGERNGELEQDMAQMRTMVRAANRDLEARPTANAMNDIMRHGRPFYVFNTMPAGTPFTNANLRSMVIDDPLASADDKRNAKRMIERNRRWSYADARGDIPGARVPQARVA